VALLAIKAFHSQTTQAPGVDKTKVVYGVWDCWMLYAG